ncbi:hypothetical protein EH221_04455 [bacterium]|nr:MAG: hypothetical protein EH221_04455 [bacterium]
MALNIQGKLQPTPTNRLKALHFRVKELAAGGFLEEAIALIDIVAAEDKILSTEYGHKLNKLKEIAKEIYEAEMTFES